MSTSDPLDLDRQICFPLYAATRAVTGRYTEVLADVGLTYPQYLVMLALWERSPRTVKDIGEALSLDPATLSPLLKRLETAGFITRTRNPDDERALDVKLTIYGQALRAEAERVPAQIVERLGMQVSELEQIRDGLTRLLAASR